MLSKSEIKELNSLHQKKYRESKSEYLAEGDKLVKEAMSASVDVQKVYATKEWDGWDEVEKQGLKHELIDERQLTQICELRSPNKAVALINMAKDSSKNTATSPQLLEGWSIYLDRLRDPGNLGTILRIADWYGIKRLICSNDSVDKYNQKVIQASMGAIVRTEVIYLSDEELIEAAKTASTPLLATVLSGESIHKTSSPPHGVLMMGNEARGLSDKLIDAAEHQVTIPGGGGAESLNVGVATGILVDWAIRD